MSVRVRLRSARKIESRQQDEHSQSSMLRLSPSDYHPIARAAVAKRTNKHKMGRLQTSEGVDKNYFFPLSSPAKCRAW